MKDHLIMNVTAVQEHILRTMLYYDIFNYPLKAAEVYRFLGTNHLSEEVVASNLQQLTDHSLLYRFGDFFSVQPEEINVTRRIKGNQTAEVYMSIAQRQAQRIAVFPFVRAVMASGSLSKNYMDENSDLDFFIVTEPGRLWIARTLLVTYKRLFLFNSHKYFCINYFVDSDHLEIEEKNLFTATELATVIPLHNGVAYQKLHEANTWLEAFFPNYHVRDTAHLPPVKDGILKKIMERCIAPFGSVLEKFFMGLTLQRWKRIYQRDYPDADFKIAFKSKKYASKNHPKHYQRKVMDLYQEKLNAFGNTHGINWRS